MSLLTVVLISAVVLTVDTFVPGWKPRDLQQAYLPFLEGVGIALGSVRAHNMRAALSILCVAIGVIEKVVAWNYSVGVVELVLFVVVMGALLVQHRGGVRSTDASAWQVSALVRPVPRALQQIPLVRAMGWVSLGVGLLVAVVVPVFLSNSQIYLLTTVVAFAIAGLSVMILTGYSGQISLGHGAFFALGGYAMGMYLMRQIGDRGVYANPSLPDFMVFLNWGELPWYWHGFDMFWFAALMVVLVPSAVALVFGWFPCRSRVTGVYLSIITQAMTFALLLAFFRNDMGFGGNNGLTDFKDILGFNIQAAGTRAALFAASAIALALSLVITSGIVRSKFGRCWWRCAMRKAARASWATASST